VSRLLVVEDDDAIAGPLVRALQAQGYAVEHVTGGVPAIERVAVGGIDLVLLDLTLPDRDGLDVCRDLRRVGSDVQIVMLTARSGELDLVVGLDAGADDYVSKPFRVAELLARVRARLREAAGGGGGEQIATAGDVRVDLAAHRAHQGDRELDLTPTEFSLLALLVREFGRAVPRDEIMRTVWGPDWYGSSRTLDVHISALRRKLDDDPAEPRLLTTVRGVGFRFEG
jgi:DNA-binding response OmpR family regulator